MRSLSPLFLIIVGLVAGLSGCTFQTPNSIRRVWCDHNTLYEPALYLEKHDHLPYHHARVDYYRWMYNMGPIVPVAPLPEPRMDGPARPPGCCGDAVCGSGPGCPCGDSERSMGPPVIVPQQAAPAGPQVLPNPADFEPPPLPSKPPGVSSEAPMADGLRTIQLATGAQYEVPERKTVVQPRGAWLFGR